MNQTVVGLFNKSSEAQEAVQQLQSYGFSTSDIDLSIGTSQDTTDTKNTNFALDTNDEKESGVARFFKNLFGSDDDTNEQVTRYSNAASKGRSVVTVHADSAEKARNAVSILDDCGAVDVDNDVDDYDNNDNNDMITGAAPVGIFNETAGAGAATPDMDTTTGTFDMQNNDLTTSTGTNTKDDASISIIEEQMNVGKRTVETGGAKLRSRIVERPVEESLRLKEERVYVNRNPVNRVASEADFNAFKEGEIEMKETAEVPVVSKEARVVEEVSLGKEVNERTETVSSTVRKTEVDIEELPKANSKTITLTKNANRKNN